MDKFADIFGYISEGPSIGYYNLPEHDLIPTGGTGGGSFQVDEPMYVDFEPEAESLQAIDIKKFLKCFDTVPDEGSKCSIEIFADIPVDSNPNKLIDYKTGSPGHTFLQIKKTQGANTVLQNIGFYPVSGWKTVLTTAPINGKFVDNGDHEFNAGFIQNITPEQLKRVLTKVSSQARVPKYDIDDYNCTDFALNVFNEIRISNPLEIPKYDIPGGTAPLGTSTPQGLYNKLKEMQQAGIESANINIPGVKGWVSDSHGPCN